MRKKSVVPNVIPYTLFGTDLQFFPFLHSLDGLTRRVSDFVARRVVMYGTEI